jgi:hypothetical protein
MKTGILATALCVLISVSAANADPAEANILGISPSIEPASFNAFVMENLAHFRGGWHCATIEQTHTCYSNTSNIEVLDNTDDSLSLFVTEDMQMLVASCGVFDACEEFGMEALFPAITEGKINFPTDEARIVQRSANTIIEYENGVFMVDVSDGYIKMSVNR